MKMFAFVLLILAVIKIATPQMPFAGSCPDATVVTNFNVTKYGGKWYEAKRYFAIFQLGGKCVTAEYTLNDNGTVHVKNQQIQSYNDKKTSIDGIARLASTTGEAKLLVTFPSLPVQFDAPYWVLGTDYDSYSVVWSCVDLGFLNFQNAWVLTRESSPSADTLEKANSVLDKQNIDKSYFLKTDQINCPATN